MTFNHRAYEENKKNEAHVQIRGDHIIVDGSKATYQGIPIKNLNQAGRRKFETLVKLSNANKVKVNTKIHYN